MDSKRCALRKLRGAFVNACKCVPHFAPNISIDICNFYFFYLNEKTLLFFCTSVPFLLKKHPRNARIEADREAQKARRNGSIEKVAFF